MQHKKFTINSRNLLFTSMFACAMIFVTSCSRKMSFGVSSVAPAAEGSVKIKHDKNKNSKIELSVIRLTSPDRLTPPKSIYVVWMETSDNGTKNIGSLNTSSSLFSKTLKSSLSTVTAYKPTGFFITAEDNATLQYPAGVVVLKTN